jgi:GC-rich sequence DNA-binding factor
MLLKSFQLSFQEAVTETEALVSQYRALSKPSFDPDAIPARRRFLARRIKLLQNIVGWRQYTGEKFGVGELITRLVDHSIMPLAESGWEVGGEESIQKVLDSSLFSRAVLM